MTMSSIHPAHAIRHYLWSRIEEEGILDRLNYVSPDVPEGLIPIVPVEEDTELMKIIDAQPGVGSYPYIVYTWNRISGGPAWFLKTHEISFAIRATDDVKMRQLINLFDNAFEDLDAAARRVNEYIATGPEVFRRYHFKYIMLMSLGSQGPAESENGVKESLVIIRANFSDGTGKTF